jgi:hypothetical protein
MNPENNLEPVLHLMQNVVDQLAHNELTLTKGFKEILDAAKQPELEHKNEPIEKLNDIQKELITLIGTLNEMNKHNEQKTNLIMKSLAENAEFVKLKKESNEPTVIHNTTTKKVTVFGEKSALTVRNIFSVVVILTFLIFTTKYLFEFSNKRSQLQQERDVFFKTYRFVALSALELNDTNFVNFITSSMIGFKNNNADLESKYKAMENNYQKEMKKHTLKVELNKIENDSEN